VAVRAIWRSNKLRRHSGSDAAWKAAGQERPLKLPAFETAVPTANGAQHPQDLFHARAKAVEAWFAVCLVVASTPGRLFSVDDAALRARPSLESVGDKVYCLCGCVTTLNRCPHLPSECWSRRQTEEAIRTDIAQGKDEAAILQDLVQRYGVQVLAAPPVKGLDLAAWLLPGFGLVTGLILVVWVVRRWHHPAGRPPEPPVAVDPKLMMAIEEEMKTLED
jgi:hypothetical protein